MNNNRLLPHASIDDEIAALRFAANECRWQANSLLSHARDAQRRARDYERREAAMIATKTATQT